MTDFDLRFFQDRYEYDPLTGIISSRVNTHGHGKRIPKGTPVGYASEGRVRISITTNGISKQFRAHRVAWLLMTGEWPVMGIDHIDGDATNNRWSNLRLATQSQNNMNKRMQSNNTSGYRGVTHNGSGWMAQIWIRRRNIYLGTYKTREEAYAVYCKMSDAIHGEFSRIS